MKGKREKKKNNSINTWKEIKLGYNRDQNIISESSPTLT